MDDFSRKISKGGIGWKVQTRAQLKKISVGWTPFLVLMALSFNANAQRVSVVPPEVGANWELNKIRILSSGNAWAVGVDVANKRGVILQLKDHIWSAVNPPVVSSDWELNSVHFPSAAAGWAGGDDYAD